MFLIFLLWIFGTPIASWAATPNLFENRVALVLGVSDYNSPDKFDLPNAAADVEGVSLQLQALGFKVTRQINPRTSQIPRILESFKASLSPGAVAFFYFSGHGFQSEGQNFLLLDPLPAKGITAHDVKRSSLALSDVFLALENARTQVNVVLLDACRTPPGKGVVATGLAEVTAPGNTVVGFATYPGGVALQFDNDRYSLYTKYLVPSMGVPGKTIEQVLKSVGKGVYQETRQESKPQQPWLQSSLYDDFYLVHSEQLKTRGNEKGDVERWFIIKDSLDPGDFESYLRQFPSGIYTLHAKKRLHALTESDHRLPSNVDKAHALTYWTKNREILTGRGLFERLDEIVANTSDPVGTLRSAINSNDVALVLWCALLTHERYRFPGKREAEWSSCNQKRLLATPAGQFIIGRAMYFGRGTGQDQSGGVSLISRSAAEGNPLAANFLGDLHFNSTTPDCAAMKRNYLLAAKGGNSNAFNNIGVAYLTGRCFIQDPYEARQWFRKAATMGNDWGETNLGMMLLTGNGGAPDFDEGLRQITSAARKGNVQAWLLLGKYFELFPGTRDEEKAMYWYRRTLAETSETDLIEVAKAGLARVSK